MKSKVYFIPVKDAESIASLNVKLQRLLDVSRLLDFIRKDDKVAVKVHFGEEGNVNFVGPEHLRVVCAKISEKGGNPLVSDANTLYRGKRLNTRDHLKIAREHGFSEENLGARVVIPDDTHKDQVLEIKIEQRHVKTAKVARFFIEADGLVTVSHFKGHILTGFGGALKNIGMGCATREGKLAQHCDVAPVVLVDSCVGCGECAAVCPTGAIRIENKKSMIEKSKCIGCASCMEACPTMAMFVDLEAGDEVQEKMAEYCLAVLKNKSGKTAFVNFALKISKECDCWGDENPLIGPDVGILASCDPVALDRASWEVVLEKCGRDIFKEAHPGKDGMKQLTYAEKLGLGSLNYELIQL